MDPSGAVISVLERLGLVWDVVRISPERQAAEGRRRLEPVATTEHLRRELEAALPDRPFSLELWDGTRLPATNAPRGPTFYARSADAVAHMLRAPGQLGVGRAYVSGAIEPTTSTRRIDLLDSWKPPSLDSAHQGELALAAARACGPMRPPARARRRAQAARASATASSATPAPSATTTTCPPTSSASSSTRG